MTMWELRNLDTGEVVIAKHFNCYWAYRFVATSLEGEQYWYEDGELHREDGPAIIHLDKVQEWFFEGKRHRIGGPSIVRPSGVNSWYNHGRFTKKNNY